MPTAPPRVAGGIGAALSNHVRVHSATHVDPGSGHAYGPGGESRSAPKVWLFRTGITGDAHVRPSAAGADPRAYRTHKPRRERPKQTPASEPPRKGRADLGRDKYF